MAETRDVAGVLQVLTGPSQGPAPAGVIYIYGLTDGSIAIQGDTGGEIVIGGPGLHLKESHVMLAMSETEVAVP